ncbi:peptidase M61 domain protein [Halothece sp. PCC 7418]|uniref:M61 family metallopeptidase n=1 Tax=Halothece sp. (strain PCC 7418) TaxID=65093 RepID=UPI0002A05FDB|nr:M61 family metallopeptidase [Halothece sp. PCC 7418]AFZ43869.1 peptidase M61 domain protein [Halothece sp. PCC 7418]
MTEATITRQPQTEQTQAQLSYEVSFPEPQTHLFLVKLQVSDWKPDTLKIQFPVWTPGSYLVREYARHIQQVTAYHTETQQELSLEKISKNCWQIKTQQADQITIQYQVYANELTVRTNHLDATHGYFNGAALFFDVPALETTPIEVKIIPPATDWKITTPLPEVEGKTNTFLADDFDTLVDSPFEIGTHDIYNFEVLEKPHQLAIWGKGNANPEQIINDIKKIIVTEAEIYRELPYDHYIFLLHQSASGFGGLEHKNCCSLIYPRFGFQSEEKYNRFMQLVAHEFFHLWNVKRIRPKALETFDYSQENYTTALWFAEGTTSYYDALLPMRAGIYDARTCLDNLGKDITRFLQTPGRKVQPLAESSFDAWIKLYRRDANSDNNQISYYLKGELVSLLLDLLIRTKHNNQRSMDDVLLALWEQFGKPEIGYTDEQLKSVLESIADTDLTEFLDTYLHTTKELPLADYLQPFGLQLIPSEEDDAAPYLGMRVAQENGSTMIKFVDAESPAGLAGIDAGDELLAINGIRVNADQISDRAKDYQPGDKITLTIFHQDELLNHTITLASPQPSGYKITSIDEPSEAQKELLFGWLGVTTV